MLPLPILNIRLNACHENWQQMTPVAQGHHCAQCNRTVLDFTAASQADVDAAFRASADGRVCGRFRAEQLAPTPPLRPKLRRFLVALVLVCGVGLSGREAVAQEVPTKSNSSFPAGFVPDDPLWHCSSCQYPVYKDGGFAGMLNAIASNVRYPHHLQDGRVFVQFTIDEMGKVRNAVVKQGLRPDADSAVLRAVRMLGDFTPALDTQGRRIAVKQTVPITFQLK